MIQQLYAIYMKDMEKLFYRVSQKIVEKDFSKALTRLQDAGIKKLVLDLRNNGGGYLNAALEISSSLIPKNQLYLQKKIRMEK